MARNYYVRISQTITPGVGVSDARRNIVWRMRQHVRRLRRDKPTRAYRGRRDSVAAELRELRAEIWRQWRLLPEIMYGDYVWPPSPWRWI